MGKLQLPVRNWVRSNPFEWKYQQMLVKRRAGDQCWGEFRGAASQCWLRKPKIPILPIRIMWHIIGSFLLFHFCFQTCSSSFFFSPSLNTRLDHVNFRWFDNFDFLQKCNFIYFSLIIRSLKIRLLFSSNRLILKSGIIFVLFGFFSSAFKFCQFSYLNSCCNFGEVNIWLDGEKLFKTCV